MINYYIVGLLALIAILIIYFLSRESVKSNRVDLLNSRFSEFEGKILKTVLDQLNSVTDQVNKALKENRETIHNSSQAMYRQIHDFSTGMSKISENLKQVQDSVKEVSSFQNIFKSPKLRGGWGEISLDNLLKEYLGEDVYIKQYYFKSGEAVDFVVKLPNDLLLPIDAKFPVENFQKMIEAENEKSEITYKKMFIEDVKRHIDSIATKYILPAEGTVEVALMFIPAEAIYYEIINTIKEVDLSDYAFKRRVIATSPNTLRLHIAAIRHWFRDLQVSKQTQAILKKLGQIVQDAQKLAISFQKLGKHLNDAKSSFEDSEKRLSFLAERSNKLLEIGDKTEEKK